MDKKPFIHLFQTSNGFYVYDVNTDSILQLEEEVYKYLKNEQIGEINDFTPKYVDFLKNKGYLKENRVMITEHPETEYLKYHCNNKVEGITLQVTQNCNLRCSYCTYSGGYINRVHSNKRMTKELAKKSIDFLIKHSRDCQELSIGFYGGEPLLEIDLIKWCVEYSKECVEGKEIRYNITTNATLITEEIIEFFNKHNVLLMISLDGPEDIHDKNRKFAGTNTGSFKTILENLKMISEKFPEYFKNNVHYNTVLETNNFSCVSKFLNKEELFNNALFLSSLVSEVNSIKKIDKSNSFYEESQYALFIGFLNILGRIKIEDTSKLLSTQLASIGNTRRGKQGKQRLIIPEKWHHGGPCIPGAMRLLINAYGDFYPCEKVCEDSDDTIIGDIEQGYNFKKIENMLNIERISSEKCHNCWAYQECTLCVACIGNSPTEDILLKECEKVRNNVENDYKDYCVLTGLEYDFEIKELGKSYS